MTGKNSNLPLMTVALTLGFLTVGTAAFAAVEVARVNNRVITDQELNRKFDEAKKYLQFSNPTRSSVLDDLIKRELAIQEARKQGLDKDPEILERIETVLYHALLEKRLSKDLEKISVTDQEAQNFYGKNPEIRTSHIFVAVPPAASKEAEKAALDKITSIRDTHLRPGKMSFAEVAQRFSEGPAAPMGGDIDYQTRDRLDPNYYAAAVKLKSPGDTSGIIRTQFGYHIIRLTAIRPWNGTDKARIKRLVFEEKRDEIFERYMAGLKRGAKISINKSAIKD